MKIEEVLRELGNEYSIRVIDLERVIYRDFGSFDIEVSGLGRRKFGCTIYVWGKNPDLHIVESHLVESLDALKTVLAELSCRF